MAGCMSTMATLRAKTAARSCCLRVAYRCRLDPSTCRGRLSADKPSRRRRALESFWCRPGISVSQSAVLRAVGFPERAGRSSGGMIRTRGAGAACTAPVACEEIGIHREICPEHRMKFSTTIACMAALCPIASSLPAEEAMVAQLKTELQQLQREFEKTRQLQE